MSEFYDLLDEYIGESDSTADIRAVVRRCWFYDFDGYPVRIWQGQGKLFAGGQQWLGSIDPRGKDIHRTARFSDGRDGSSPISTMTLQIVDFPGQPALQTYEAIKKDQWRVSGRKLICYLAIFRVEEGLRPQTPLSFFKEMIMMSTTFSEKIDQGSNGIISKQYSVSVKCKDGNFGRSEVPGGTYTDSIQKERALQLGGGLDRGCEYLALLANRTYQLP